MELRYGELLVDDLIGNQCIVFPGENFVIGRLGDFVVGREDTSLHRNFLHLWSNETQWFIKNIGTFVTASILPPTNVGLSRATLPPENIQVLHPGTSSIYFSTANMKYEVSVTVAQPLRAPKAVFASSGPFTANVFEPNPEQRQLLEVLARPLLTDPSAEARVVVPSQKAVASELGWTEKKVERKIQTIAETLEKLGVPQFQPGQKVPWRLILAEFSASNPRFFADN